MAANATDGLTPPDAAVRTPAPLTVAAITLPDHEPTPAAATDEALIRLPALTLPIEPPAIKTQAIADRVLTITLGGDIGLGGSDQPVHADGAYRHGSRQSWSDLTAGIAPLLTGDLNFANLETVVTDRNDLTQVNKAFNFRSHPAGVRHLVGIGFNVFSTANNHAIDYGSGGLAETIRHLGALEARGLKAWPGIGLGRQAAGRPSEIKIKGSTIRISAIGIGGNRAETGPSMLAYSSQVDFNETVARLIDAPADLRILSVHYGPEMQVRPGAGDERRLRDDAVRQAGIDIVVGHHAHVAAGMQMVDGKLVLYGLGNLLHPGMQNMAGKGICHDYGLMARVHLAPGPDGRLRTYAVEAIGLTDMHQRATPLTGDAGRTRIAVLNHLASGLDHTATGARGLRFTALPNGRGLACLPGADTAPGSIGDLCRSWTPPDDPAPGLASRVAAACGGNQIARRTTGRVLADTQATNRPRSSPVRKVSGERTAPAPSLFGLFGN